MKKNLEAPPRPPGHDPTAAARRRMVEEQLRAPDRGITHPGVLDAMARVPREAFTPDALRAEAFDDTALPLGHGQTLSQPFIVAFMTAQLQPRPTDRVLEIGTGSGYQAAVLAGLVREVFTLEIIPALVERAQETLRQLGIQNVQVRCGDGHEGWPAQGSFDAIMATCAPTEVPPRLIEQLKDGGRMVLPVGPRFNQQIHLLHKAEGQLIQHAILPVRFVPMTRHPQPDAV